MAAQPVRWARLKAIVGVCAAVAVVGFVQYAPSTTPARSPEQVERVTTLVETMVNAGLVRMDVRLNKAWVDPDAWASFDASRKEQLTHALAIYCELKGDTARIRVYDAQSARELAGVSGGVFYVK